MFRYSEECNVTIQKTPQEHAKLLKRTSLAAIKEMSTETEIGKKNISQSAQSVRNMKKRSIERR
jgi:hypothetical protein